MGDRRYRGLLCIGDPHCASRTPGFRKDDYPRTILEKLRWSLEYAEREALVPVLLGDVFHYPRDNANWLLTELARLFGGREVYSIAGNHDCSEDALVPDDSLSVLAAAGVLKLLDVCGPQRLSISGSTVVLGGTSWGQDLPKSFDRLGDDSLVVWLTHHDVIFTGYEEAGRFEPGELPGIDLVINGHIHRHLQDCCHGRTTWLCPGNIARIKRSDASRDHVPALLRVDTAGNGTWQQRHVPLPCAAFDDVFHPELLSEEIPLNDSLFIKGLESLTSFKTQGGAGLMQFLDENLAQFDPRVAREIRTLAEELCLDAPDA